MTYLPSPTMKSNCMQPLEKFVYFHSLVNNINLAKTNVYSFSINGYYLYILSALFLCEKNGVCRNMVFYEELLIM